MKPGSAPAPILQQSTDHRMNPQPTVSPVHNPHSGPPEVSFYIYRLVVTPTFESAGVLAGKSALRHCGSRSVCVIPDRDFSCRSIVGFLCTGRGGCQRWL